MKEYVIGSIAVLALVLGALGLVSSKPTEQPLGASSGPEHLVTQYFYDSFASGNGCYSTTTTGVLTSAALERNSCIVIAATGAGQGVLTLTTQGSTTMAALVPKVGMCRSWWIDATAVAAATTTTFAAGTGINLVGLDATGAGTGADVLDGNEYGRFTLCRETDSDVVGFVHEYIHAD